MAYDYDSSANQCGCLEKVLETERTIEGEDLDDQKTRVVICREEDVENVSRDETDGDERKLVKIPSNSFIAEGGYRQAQKGITRMGRHDAVVCLKTERYKIPRKAVAKWRRSKDEAEVELLRKLTAASYSERTESFVVEFYFACVITTGSMTGSILLCEEYFDGNDLQLDINERRKTGKSYDTYCLLTALRQLSSAVCYIKDRGIRHLDMKPGNVLMKIVQNQLICKLVDFNLSMVVLYPDDPEGCTVGTTVFKAPEVIIEEKCQLQTDYWGIGITVYSMAALQIPWIDVLPLHAPDYHKAMVIGQHMRARCDCHGLIPLLRCDETNVIAHKIDEVVYSCIVDLLHYDYNDRISPDEVICRTNIKAKRYNTCGCGLESSNFDNNRLVYRNEWPFLSCIKGQPDEPYPPADGSVV